MILENPVAQQRVYIMPIVGPAMKSEDTLVHRLFSPFANLSSIRYVTGQPFQ